MTVYVTTNSSPFMKTGAVEAQNIDVQGLYMTYLGVSIHRV